MIILGIDPAIRTSGYGVIECTEKGEIKVLDCGIIVNKPKMLHTECLRRIAGGVAELLKTYKIDCAAIEEPFVGKNSKTAIILGMARGAFLANLQKMIFLFIHTVQDWRKKRQSVTAVQKKSR